MTERLVAAVLAACWAANASAGPLAVTDRYPVTRIHALPAAESARVSQAPPVEWSATLDWSSYATSKENARETLVLDGESVALTLRWRRAAGSWRLGVDVPFMHQSGGVLDGVIDTYHDLFGFPDGDRPRLPDDALLYRYVRDGETLVNVDAAGAGVGDVTVHAARSLREAPGHAFALRLHVKLPTGDSDRLFGSGAAAFGAQIDALRSVTWRDRDVDWYAALGAQVSGRGDVLSALRETTVAYGHAGVRFAWRPTIDLIAQIDAHGPFYDAGQRGLGRGILFSAGGRFALGSRWMLDLAVAEDIAPRTAPDVTFHARLARRR